MQKEKLRAVIKHKGHTQQHLADAIATDLSNYSRKESGDIRITETEWEKIASFLEAHMKIRKKRNLEKAPPVVKRGLAPPFILKQILQMI